MNTTSYVVILIKHGLRVCTRILAPSHRLKEDPLLPRISIRQLDPSITSLPITVLSWRLTMHLISPSLKQETILRLSRALIPMAADTNTESSDKCEVIYPLQGPPPS